MAKKIYYAVHDVVFFEGDGPCPFRDPIVDSTDQLESWHNVLRFGPIQFTRGGSYKVCFCHGSDAGGPGGNCSMPSDFSVDVGLLQITALPQSVLLDHQTTRSGFGSESMQCESQYPGPGLYCAADVS